MLCQYWKWTGNKKTEGVKEPAPEETKKTHFYGDVKLDSLRFFRDAESIEKELLKHLTSIKGADVKITLHIDASFDEGFTQELERIIKENGRTLGFDNIEFE